MISGKPQRSHRQLVPFSRKDNFAKSFALLNFSRAVAFPATLSRDPLSRDPLSRDPLSRDPLSRDPLSRNPLSRDPLSRDPLSRDPLSRDPLSRDPPLAGSPLAGSPRAALSCSRSLKLRGMDPPESPDLPLALTQPSRDPRNFVSRIPRIRQIPPYFTFGGSDAFRGSSPRHFTVSRTGGQRSQRGSPCMCAYACAGPSRMV